MFGANCILAGREKGLSSSPTPTGEVVSLTNGRVSVSFDLGTGLLSYAAGGRRLIEGAYLSAMVNGQEHASPQFQWDEWHKSAVLDALGHGNSLVITGTQKSAGLHWTLEITVYDGKDYGIFQNTLTNVGQQPVRVENWKLLAIEANGKFLEGISPREVVVFLNGYTSVGYRGVVPMLPIPYTAVSASLPDGTGNLRLGDYSGWWVHLLWSQEKKAGLIAAALTAERWKTFIDVRQGLFSSHFSRWNVSNLGSALLQPGQALRSERMMIGACNDPLACLEDYALAVRKANQARLAPPSFGWCSWPYYYRRITEADVLRNAQFMKEKLSSRYQYVLIDSGWFTLRGDWQANEKFPQGMKATAQKIRALGLKPGLWFAPFLVDKGSALLREHPDWFVRNEDGSLYVFRQDPGAPERYVLDGSHPQVQEWLQRLFSLVVNDWGYEYLKLDFLHAGAVEGQRYDPTVTSLEALRQGLKAIRKGSGDRTYIQQAIGPWLAAVGILDESRMSMDTEFRLTSDYTTSDIPWLNWQYATWYLRNNMAGYFAKGNLFNVQPGEGIRLGPWSPDEARTIIAVYALTGGLWLAGDLTTLSPEQVTLLNNPNLLELGAERRSTPNSGGKARPLDLFEAPDWLGGVGTMQVFQDSQRLTFRTLPRIWHVQRDGVHYVGLFNWGDNRATMVLPLARIGLDPGRQYAVFDAWTNEKIGEYKGNISLAIAGHGHMLLRVQE